MSTAGARARAILQEFGSLHVGKVGPGNDAPASDVHFYGTLRPEATAIAHPWQQQIGETAAFASAHNDHMILLVNNVGEYFVLTDPDEQLYSAGSSFGGLMELLLLGHKLGSPLRGDA